VKVEHLCTKLSIGYPYLQERNAVLERGLAASEDELTRQSRRADQAASQLQQSIVRLTQLERNEGSGMAHRNGTEHLTDIESGLSFAELIEVQANEVRKAAEECASAQQKASVLESGFRQLRALCDELQRELARSVHEAESWRNAAERTQQRLAKARDEAAEAMEKVTQSGTGPGLLFDASRLRGFICNELRCDLAR
jgi:chromosome segregation ATPase